MPGNKENPHFNPTLKRETSVFHTLETVERSEDATRTWDSLGDQIANCLWTLDQWTSALPSDDLGGAVLVIDGREVGQTARLYESLKDCPLTIGEEVRAFSIVSIRRKHK